MNKYENIKISNLKAQFSVIEFQQFHLSFEKYRAKRNLQVPTSDRNRSKILNWLTECFKIPVNRLTVVKCL